MFFPKAFATNNGILQARGKVLVALLSLSSTPALLLSTISEVQAATVFEGLFTGTEPGCQAENFCTGLGTSTFGFGEPFDTSSYPTSLTFIPASYTERPSGDFLIGTLRIINGVIFQSSSLGVDVSSTSRVATLQLSLRALTDGVFNSGDEGVFRIAYEGTLNLDPETRSPVNADRVFFPDFPEFGSVSILEGTDMDLTTYNVGILARFGSIQPVGFQPLPSDPTAANGFVGSAPGSTPVPTPALLPGLMGMGLGLWRKRKGAMAQAQA